jgi:hypothetical protein
VEPHFYDPREPNRAGLGMRGGNNSELDGESEEEHPRPENYFTPRSTSRRPGYHRQPKPDVGGTHEDGHSRFLFRDSDLGDHFPERSRHYPQEAAPPMPARGIHSGVFRLTERQQLREDESRPLKDIELQPTSIFFNTRYSAAKPIRTT